MLTQQAVYDLLREAARRGRVRQRELAEHAREAYAHGPEARMRTEEGHYLRSEGNIKAHIASRYVRTDGPRARRQRAEAT